MSSRTKKHIWPASLAIVLGLAAMVAVLMLPVGSAQAQPTNPLKPSTPVLTRTVDSASQITLSWMASTTEAGLTITGYMVQRKSRHRRFHSRFSRSRGYRHHVCGHGLDAIHIVYLPGPGHGQ